MVTRLSRVCALCSQSLPADASGPLLCWCLNEFWVHDACVESGACPECGEAWRQPRFGPRPEGATIGKHGGKNHHDLVDLVRCELPPRLRAAGYSGAGCIAAEIMMAVLIPSSSRRAGPGPQPDVLLVSGLHQDVSPIVVEVGRYRPEKWDASVPVLHVSFSGYASLINATGSGFERVALNEIRTLLNEQWDVAV
jgi:hypothetical protein